jgi:hypothetical protein
MIMFTIIRFLLYSMRPIGSHFSENPLQFFQFINQKMLKSTDPTFEKLLLHELDKKSYQKRLDKLV